MKGAEHKNARQLRLPVEGMTCAACVGHVEGALKEVRGVSSVKVNLATEKAFLELDSGAASLAELVAAVDGVGYTVPVERAGLNIGGMTCAACVSHVQEALGSVSGVLSVNVNLATEKAVVEHVPGVASLQDFREAVDEAGYSVEGLADKEYGHKEELERLARVKETRTLRNKFRLRRRPGRGPLPGQLRRVPLGIRPDGPGLLPLPPVGAGNSGAVLGRPHVLHLRPRRAETRGGQHAHPHSPRHQRSLLLQRGRRAHPYLLSRYPVGQWDRGFGVLRHLGNHHRPHTSGAVPGGPRQGSHL